MLLTTKQVRAIAKQAGFGGAQWTDKTSDYDDTRRSVVWCFNNDKDADRLAWVLKAEFARQGVENTVKRTGVVDNWANWTDGGQYVRVMAHIA